MRSKPRPTLIAALAVGTVVVVLIALLATRSAGNRDQETSPIEGRFAPAIEGEVVLGEPFDIATAESWVVVNFFATWCGPCRVEHPELVAFEEAHREAGDAKVISVVYDERAQDVVDFFEAQGGEWPVVGNDEGRTAFDWGVTGVPESYLVAPSGIVVKRIRGGVTQADLDALIDAYETAFAAEAEAGSSGGGGA